MLAALRAWPSNNPWKLAIGTNALTFATMQWDLLSLALSMI